MNERDYLIAEVMAIASGAMTISTISAMCILFNLGFSISLIITVSFIAFTTFFFGLYFHMKRRIWILENEQIIIQHRGDKPE